jgi:uncharacterized protein (DUF1501 family)
MPHALTMSRRRWLQAAASLPAMGLLPRAAQAAGDYKALVCVFLYGGNDGLNSLVPTDSRYADYAGVRKGLALPLNALLPLDGVPYGLHPSLAALKPLWDAGQMASVANVGTLKRPFAHRQDYVDALAAKSPDIPYQLYSHSDQQRAWQGADGEAFSHSGWGGRAAALLGSGQPVMALGGNNHFGNAETSQALALPGPGGGFQISGVQSPVDAYQRALSTGFQKLYAKADYGSDLSKAFVRMQLDAMSVSAELSPVVQPKPDALPADDPLRVQFAGLARSDLGMQLFQVAKLIRHGRDKGASRQIFFVQSGGFDTHAGQLTRHAALLQDLGTALAAFQAGITAMGLADAVVSFTESDFGRTFVPNNNGGTDHAWGNLHFVLGGPVKGRAVYGTYPTLNPQGADDAGVQSWEHQGRWVPTTSVEQYAATLLGWWGATEAQQLSLLPQLARFPTRRLNFL